MRQTLATASGNRNHRGQTPAALKAGTTAAFCLPSQGDRRQGGHWHPMSSPHNCWTFWEADTEIELCSHPHLNMVHPRSGCNEWVVLTRSHGSARGSRATESPSLFILLHIEHSCLTCNHLISSAATPDSYITSSYRHQMTAKHFILTWVNLIKNSIHYSSS